MSTAQHACARPHRAPATPSLSFPATLRGAVTAALGTLTRRWPLAPEPGWWVHREMGGHGPGEV